ncbi:MAG: TIGR03089 family protein [Jatrophihabitantaceae bacterium]
MTPEQAFADLLSTAPSRPFVTYYDESSGERSELSVKSAANWVAKTHHLLATELGLGVGDRALVALPAHWISVPVLLGCLTAGLELTDDPALADIAFVSPTSLDGALTVPDVYAVAPDAAAVGFRDTPPAGSLDFVTAVRPQADAWSSVRLVASSDDPCLQGYSRGEVVDLARQRAVDLGLASGGRLLTARDWLTPADWIDTLLAPLVVGGSVIYVRNCIDASVLERRMTQERATAHS